MEHNQNPIRKREKKNWFYSFNMIFEQLISEHAKIVYIFLCRCADEEGQSFPSYTTIAQKCGISRRTAIYAVDELMMLGLLSKDIRTRDNGSKTSNIYTIYDEPTCITEIPPLVQEVHHPSARDALPLVQEMHPPSAGGAPPEVLPSIRTTQKEVHPTVIIVRHKNQTEQAIKVWEQEVARPANRKEIDLVISMVSQSGLDLFRAALKESIMCGNWSLKYVDQILNRYKQAGIRTPLEVEEDRQRFLEKKQKRKGKGTQ